MTPFGEEICSDICPLKLSVPKRVQFTFQERNYKFKLLRCRIPCKNIAIVSSEKEIKSQDKYSSIF